VTSDVTSEIHGLINESVLCVTAGKYTWDKLSSARDERELLRHQQGEADANDAEEEEYDEEEMLQRGMQQRFETLRNAKHQLFSDESSSGSTDFIKSNCSFSFLHCRRRRD
jgi:hypothetical protein